MSVWLVSWVPRWPESVAVHPDGLQSLLAAATVPEWLSDRLSPDCDTKQEWSRLLASALGEAEEN